MFGTYIPPKGDAARQPLWAKARAYIVRRLSEGVWRPGEMLPSEKDLAAELGVSLGTVRRAVDSLEKSGIVNRVQGKGTFVRSSSALTPIPRSASSGTAPMRSCPLRCAPCSTRPCR
jgi:DNA-binding GntR family transcriptional regulator